MTAIEGQWTFEPDHYAYVYSVKLKDPRTRYCYETLRFLMELEGCWADVYDADDVFKGADDMTFITKTGRGDAVIEFLDNVISTTALPFRFDDVKTICDSWTDSFFRGVPLEDILGRQLP